MSNSDLNKTLFEEQNLSELLKVFENAFPTPLPAKSLGFCVGVVIFLYQLLLWHFKGVDVLILQNASELITFYALTVSSALMGVVIAGMSIFAATLKPKVANGLIHTEYPNTNISSLKFIFAMFAYVLFSLFTVIACSSIHYLALGNSAFFLELFTAMWGPTQDQIFLKLALISYLSIFLGLVFFLGSLLKSFIWNLHQVLLVVAAFNSQVDE